MFGNYVSKLLPFLQEPKIFSQWLCQSIHNILYAIQSLDMYVVAFTWLYRIQHSFYYCFVVKLVFQVVMQSMFFTVLVLTTYICLLAWWSRKTHKRANDNGHLRRYYVWGVINSPCTKMAYMTQTIYSRELFQSEHLGIICFNYALHRVVENVLRTILC